MKACKILHIAFTAAYDAAAKRSYEDTVSSLKSTMSLEFVGIPRSPEGRQASVRVVKNILRTAEVQVQGWSVTDSLRKSYLKPLYDHGYMLARRLVSLESYLQLSSLHTDSLLSAMSST
jgi:hypothetical protein